MKLEITQKEAELLLSSAGSETLETVPLSNFRTAYIDSVGNGECLVSIDEVGLYLFTDKSEASQFVGTFK